MEPAAGVLQSVGRPWSGSPLETSSNLSSSGVLRVVAFDDPPYTSVRRRPDGSFSFGGYLYQLWQILSDELGLRYRMVPSLEGGYGSTDENGKWNGLVGELVSGRGDVALTWLNIRADRAAVIDIIDAVPVERERYTFYLRQGSRVVPEITPSMLGSIFKPLQLHVWLLLLVALLVLSAALCAASWYDEAKLRRAGKKQTAEELSWGMCVLSVFMSMVGQGWASTPRSSSARVITSVCWMLGMLINISYTANLISNLTVSRVDRPISSLQEFDQRPDWLLTIEKGTAVINDWRESGSALEQGLYRRAVHGDRLIQLDGTVESSRRAIQPQVLSYIDVNRLIYYLGSEACAVVPLLDQMPSYRNTYMVMAKGRDDLKQAINRVMMRLNEAGTLDRLKSLWLRSKSGVCRSSADIKSLTFGDLLPILLLLPIALISSMAILVLELIVSRRKCVFSMWSRILGLIHT